MKCDHRSEFSNLSNWKVEARKKSGLQREALIFFGLLLSNCLNWKIHCDDHTSLSCITFVSPDDNHLKDGQLCLNKTEITFVCCYIYQANNYSASVFISLRKRQAVKFRIELQLR